MTDAGDLSPPVRGYSNDQLAGFTIGVTADRRSDDLCAAFVRRGADVLHAPTLRIVPTEQDAQLVTDTELIIEAAPEVLLVTTSYGFQGWLEAADAAGLGGRLLQVLADTMILVRGPKARGAVRAAALSDSGMGEHETTAALVDRVLGEGVAGKTVAVQLHGYVDQDQLDRLTAAGAKLLTVAPYRWSPPPDPRAVVRLMDAVCARQLDAITFTSAPAAAALLQAAEESGQLRALLAAMNDDVLTVAVGNVTAEPLIRAGLHPVYPSRHRLGALVRLVCEELELHRVLTADTCAGSLQLRGRLARVADHSVLLPPTGATILKTLIRAQGSVVSKEMLRQALTETTDDHALEVAVGRLRNSLAAPGLVTTVVKRGYRLGD